MKLFEFLQENKAVILPFVGLMYSEFLSLNPKLKSNGICQMIGNLIKGNKNE